MSKPGYIRIYAPEGSTRWRHITAICRQVLGQEPTERGAACAAVDWALRDAVARLAQQPAASDRGGSDGTAKGEVNV